MGSRTPDVTLAVDGVAWNIRPDVTVYPGNTFAVMPEAREAVWSDENSDEDVGELVRKVTALSRSGGRPSSPPRPGVRPLRGSEQLTARLLTGNDEWTIYPLVEEAGRGFVMMLEADRQMWFGAMPEWDAFAEMLVEAFAISMRRPDLMPYATAYRDPAARDEPDGPADPG